MHSLVPVGTYIMRNKYTVTVVPMVYVHVRSFCWCWWNCWLSLRNRSFRYKVYI